MDKFFGIGLLLVSVLIFYFSLIGTGWAARIVCPNNPYCFGTSADDVIIGTIPNGFIRADDGNDIIIGYKNGNNVIQGENGNDTIIGGNYNDVIQGNLGNDRIEGGLGDDTIDEGFTFEQEFEGNDDISGGPGNDYISAGGGSDRIFGGPGDDIMGPSSWHRDFVKDEVDCGSGMDNVNQFYSGDGDTAVYCESINNLDGQSVVEILVELIVITSDFSEISLINSVLNNELEYSEELSQIEINDNRVSIISAIEFPILILSSALFFYWFISTYRNFTHLGALGLEFNAKWVLAYFYIPVLCLWKPYEALKEIWKVSNWLQFSL